MKIIYTPPCGSIEESNKKRKEFKKIEEMIAYIIEEQKEIIQRITTRSQYFIEYYSFNQYFQKERFIILFKDYTKRQVERYPVGFFHFEE